MVVMIMTVITIVTGARGGVARVVRTITIVAIVGAVAVVGALRGYINRVIFSQSLVFRFRFCRKVIRGRRRSLPEHYQPCSIFRKVGRGGSGLGRSTVPDFSESPGVRFRSSGRRAPGGGRRPFNRARFFGGAGRPVSIFRAACAGRRAAGVRGKAGKVGKVGRGARQGKGPGVRFRSSGRRAPGGGRRPFNRARFFGESGRPVSIFRAACAGRRSGAAAGCQVGIDGKKLAVRRAAGRRPWESV